MGDFAELSDARLMDEYRRLRSLAAEAGESADNIMGEMNRRYWAMKPITDDERKP